MLHPCDVEFTRSQISADSELKMDIKLSPVNLHVSATTLHIALDVIEILAQAGKVPVICD